jgi:hypothetical protein
MFNFLQTGILPQSDKLARRIVLESDRYYIREINDQLILCHLYQPLTKNRDKVKPLLTQIVVPSQLRLQLLQNHHQHLAHSGPGKVFLKLREKYFWPSMYSSIKKYIDSCFECQTSKRPIHPIKATLKPVPVHSLFETWHLDLAGPLKETPSKTNISFLLWISFQNGQWPGHYPVEIVH